MALSHAHPGEPIDVRPLGPRFKDAKSVALFKSGELEVVRLVLAAGKSLPPHRVLGEITLQCIEGELSVTHEDEKTLLQPGEMLFLPANALHGVQALQDTSALLTIALHSP